MRQDKGLAGAPDYFDRISGPPGSDSPIIRKDQPEGFKPGDLVMVMRDCSVIFPEGEFFFREGDVARLLYKDNAGWWADFKDQGNASVFKDGIWYVGPGDAPHMFVPLLGVI